MSDTVKELDIELLPHPLYSPDLAICDFWALLNFKNRLHGSEIGVANGVEVQEMSHDGL